MKNLVINNVKLTKDNTFFTSDTHFGHENIIKYANRPFENAQDMDDALIYNINQTCKPTDFLFHLGDWGWRNKERNYDLASKVNCNMILLLGNHDDSRMRICPYFLQIENYMEIIVDGQYIVLMHYPILSWNRQHKEKYSIMLHGHCHGNIFEDDQRMDVGVDCHDYVPISLATVLEKLKTNPKRIHPDHHTKKE